jgi:prephenate dehydratase
MSLDSMKTVAIYGEFGSYTEQASIHYFGKKAKLVPYGYISEVFEAVEDGIDYGVVPIENSIEGAVTSTYDQLIGLRLHIVGETIIKINHCLIVNQGVLLRDVKRVYSHQQALGQCKEYLRKLKVKAIPYYDTAGSVRMLKDEGLWDAAGIASVRASEIYGMKVIAKGIETNKHNYTRFFVVSKLLPKAKGNKTSIVFTAKNTPGSLYDALSAFAENGVDLTYIQSRPVVGRPWIYNFYVDFRGDARDERIRKALAALGKAAKFVKVLGAYRSARQ